MNARRILVVEDEGVIAMELAQTLRDFGCEVVDIAADGEQAIVLAAAGRPDLVLMDIYIRGAFDGIETARRIRAARDVPVVFLTAFGDAKTLDRAKQTAPYGYLIKPYRPDELRAAIEVALHKHEELDALLRKKQDEIEDISISMAQNLRAPLRALDRSAHLLMIEHGAKLDGEAAGLLARLADNARQMGGMVDGLLEFIGLSGFTPLVTRVATDELVRQVIEEHRALIESRAVDFVVGPLPECRADPALLRQILKHLIANALKLTSGTARPRIEIGARDSAGETAYYVKDNGPGLEPGNLGRLFSIGESLRAPGELDGSRLGLALARRAVECQGGRIWAESDPATGSSFFFTLGKSRSRE